MPVSATSDKSIIRVSFPVEGEPEDSKRRYESEIICFVRIGERGLEISYSHHFIRFRESSIGPFVREGERRMPLTPALEAIIEVGVMYEFWSTFSRSIRVSTAPVGQLPTEHLTGSESLDPRLA